MNLILNMCLEITLLELLPHFPGASELIHASNLKDDRSGFSLGLGYSFDM